MEVILFVIATEMNEEIINKLRNIQSKSCVIFYIFFWVFPRRQIVVGRRLPAVKINFILL